MVSDLLTRLEEGGWAEGVRLDFGMRSGPGLGLRGCWGRLLPMGGDPERRLERIARFSRDVYATSIVYPRSSSSRARATRRFSPPDSGADSASSGSAGRPTRTASPRRSDTASGSVETIALLWKNASRVGFVASSVTKP
mgnify:CR=1 FL=1